ncbi:hypothetical protein [Actinacidiphila oryziradicis]|uniref:Uncharacterized protein n=1 Tax=Actinacidiphila oryziradicis TaxID=2571141 RepID=A0A4U0RN92_9ACTN|nr:hypothetical protein [Actinacidiphila oryziradicis]TJZ96756.1 hypothetical protein FCI23_50605 [Actinacidiphila oryziradicis]
MYRKQVLTVIVLVTVFSWSVVMAVLGQVAAIAALVPSLGLLVQQIVKAFASPEAGRAAAPPPAAGRDEGHAG